MTASKRAVATAVFALGLGLTVAGCGAGQVTQTDTQVAAVNGASGQVGDIAVRDAQFAFPDNADRYYRSGSDASLIVTIVNNGTSPDQVVSVTSEIAAQARITGSTDVPPGRSLRAGSDEDDVTALPTTTGASGSSEVSSGAATPSSGSVSSGSVSSGSAQSSAPSSGSSASSSVSGSASPSGSASANPRNSPGSANQEQTVGQFSVVLTGLTRDLRPGEVAKVTFLFKNAGQLTLELPIGAPAETPRPEVTHGAGGETSHGSGH
ncbi:hypothetical protein [Goodfellowiella coeruleoviolacea]|uniref:hypothetical protein n=1 Tax=Goodfellowiella coeruleoviolacea TaxID=334858 RepID=UPI0020A5966D|nr:hypothetical protein [Goodfellowiella coeruleoviolacea]